MSKFKKDIEDGLKRYPSLYIEALQEVITVKGTFTAHDKVSGIEIEDYDVKIFFPKSYPYRFPIVEETSRKIPRDVNRHVKYDGTLCFGNPQDELNVCRSGITFTFFLDKILNTHLCREYAREKNGVYPTGERSHGYEGIWEGYYEIFDTKDKEVILKELDKIINNKPIARNATCYCTSGKKYKACHEKKAGEVMGVGRGYVIALIELLKEDLKTSL